VTDDKNHAPEGIERVRALMGQAEEVAPIEQVRGAGGNVRPLRGNVDALKPRARALLGAITWAGDLRPQLERPYLVKGWLDQGGVGQITAEVTKQRDGPTGYRFAYTLCQVELGRDQDGDPVTSCLVEPVETARAGHADVTGSARVALDLLDKVLAEAGEIHRKPQYPSGRGVALDRWREACIEAGSLSTSDNRETQLKAFRRAREGLETARLIVVRDELVWRVE